MKNKVLKAMACFVSVCMLSTSLAGCGNDDAGTSSAPSGGTNSSQQSSGGADDASTPDDGADEVTDIGADRSDGLFPAYDFGGIELKVLGYNDLGQWDPDSDRFEPTEDDDDAAIQKKAMEKAEKEDAKAYIEAKYNVKLTFVTLPTNSWEEIPPQLVMNYTSGNPDADIMDIYYQHIVTLIANGVIYDMSNDMDGRFTDNSVFNWGGKDYGIGSNMGGEGLYYNKTMIKNLGMEYTPAEMFAMGQWSYNDCFAYLQELDALMKEQIGEDAYPIFVDPTYWCIFGPAANGEKLYGDDGDLHYLTPATLETLEFYQKLIDEKLDPIPAVYDEETGELKGYNTWGYPGETFDKGEKVAIAHRAAWQADSIDKSLVELGFVPYPWGSNVGIDSSKIGQEDAYLTLDGYEQACFDGQVVCLTNGVQNKANPVEVLSMVMEWMSWDSRMSAWSGESTQSCKWLEDGLDKELYFWAGDRTRLENQYMFIKGEVISFVPLGATFYRGGSVRSALESAYNADMQALIDAGYTTSDVFTPVEVEGEDEAAE